MIDGFPVQTLEVHGKTIESERHFGPPANPSATIFNADSTENFSCVEHKIDLVNLREYLTSKPTCCVLFFNDAAYRPDFETTNYVLHVLKVIGCERIPWCTVDLKVCISRPGRAKFF